MISLIYCNICCLYLPILCLVCELIHLRFCWRELANRISFISFKGTTHAYLLKILLTYNEKRIRPLNLLINCISARSVPQLWSLKILFTFRFSNFPIIFLCNSLANSWFGIISILTLILEKLSRKLSPTEARPLWYPSVFLFLAILNAL